MLIKIKRTFSLNVFNATLKNNIYNINIVVDGTVNWNTL